MAWSGGMCWSISRLNVVVLISVRRISSPVEGDGDGYDGQRGIGAMVVAELRAAGYMESTIGQYAKTIKALSEFASGRVYSVELGARFASMTISTRTGRFSAQRRFDYRRLVAVFDSYVHSGRVNLAVRGRGGRGPRPDGAEFIALDADWEPR